MDADSINRWGIYVPGKREFHFALYSIGLSLIGFIVVMTISKIPDLGQYLFYPVAGYFLARLSLVLPAIAIDNHHSFIDSWKATKEHQLFMIGVVVFPIAISLLIGIFSFIPYIGLIISFLSIISTIFTITMLSIAFKVIEDESRF